MKNDKDYCALCGDECNFCEDYEPTANLIQIAVLAVVILFGVAAGFLWFTI